MNIDEYDEYRPAACIINEVAFIHNVLCVDWIRRDMTRPNLQSYLHNFFPASVVRLSRVFARLRCANAAERIVFLRCAETLNIVLDCAAERCDLRQITLTSCVIVRLDRVR